MTATQKERDHAQATDSNLSQFSLGESASAGNSGRLHQVSQKRKKERKRNKQQKEPRVVY